jgi:hypothetical protein
MSKVSALLVVCHHSGDFRALKCLNDKGQYFCGSKETSKRVFAEKATVEQLKAELEKLGIKIDDVDSIERVANKFYSELASLPNGLLAWDEDTHKGLFKVLEK